MARMFPLSGLLRVRSLREADAAGRLFEANEKVRRTNQRLEKFRQQSAQHELPSGPPESMLAVAASRASARSMLDELYAYAEQVRDEQYEAESEYAQARRGLKVVEKLQTRHDQQAAYEQLAAEQAVLDEAAQRLARTDEEGPR
ncbi:flagellar FliJ family protein [Nesterenkonia populi]